MHSWIFRHRQRLLAVFGMVTGESVELQNEEAAVDSPQCTPSDAQTGLELSPAPRRNRLGIPPGSFARREHYVVLAPMERRTL